MFYLCLNLIADVASIIDLLTVFSFVMKISAQASLDLGRDFVGMKYM